MCCCMPVHRETRCIQTGGETESELPGFVCAKRSLAPVLGDGMIPMVATSRVGILRRPLFARLTSAGMTEDTITALSRGL